MRLFYPDTPELPLPAGHRFPAGKYRLLLDMIREQQIVPVDRLAPSPTAMHDEVCRAHQAAYVEAVLSGTLTAEAIRRIGLPWSSVLADRAMAVVGGSIAAARSALQDGIAGQLAGGTHHAHADFGSGYCTFNDLAAAALTLLAERLVDRVAILDLDVHQGDGTAAILAGSKAPDVLTVSVHAAKNFPFRKCPSDHDFALADGVEDRDYLTVVADALGVVEAFRPDIVLYQAGVDPLVTDTLGRLSLTIDGLAERDRMVMQHCRRRGTALAVVAGGGYAWPIVETVKAYANTWRVAVDVYGTP